MRPRAGEPLTDTWSDFVSQPGAYLGRVREAGSAVVIRMGRLRVRLGRQGLVGGGPLALTIPASQIEDRCREVRRALEDGGVVQVTRWGAVDGVLEVV